MRALIIITALVSLCGSAYAQVQKPPAPQFPDIIQDFKNAVKSLNEATSAVRLTSPAPKTSLQDLTSVFKPLEDFIASLVQKDLDAAIEDANAQKPVDTEAVTCWTDIKDIAPVSIPEGAGIAYFLQKYRDLKKQSGKIAGDCSNVAPQISLGMSTAIAAVGKLLP